MGLETATYLSGLTPSWPLAGETKSQGDDHLRLIKATLQATFPGASKPFYFPTAEISSANMTLDATDNNNTLLLSTAGGALTVTLPAGLVTADKGFRCTVIKTSSDTNGITVSAAASIASKVGLTATIRVGAMYEPAIFEWSGSAWYCLKPGIVIGETFNWNNDNLPAGFLSEDGSSYNNLTYAELFAVLGSSTLLDKSGRVDVGSGIGAGLSVARGVTTQHGAESVALVTSNLPPYTPSGTNSTSTSQDTDVHVTGISDNFTSVAGAGVFRGQTRKQLTINAPTFTGTAQGGTSTPFFLYQPDTAVRKIIRAC